MITVELSRTSDWYKIPDEMARKIEEGKYLADIPSIEWAVDKWEIIVVEASALAGM